MIRIKNRTAVALALSAGLLFVQGTAFAQQDQTEQQKKAEQERKKAADAKQSGQSGLKGVQSQQSQQPQQPATQTVQQPQPQYQPPKQQPQPQPQPKPQWQPQPQPQVQPQWQGQQRRNDQAKRDRDLQQSQRQRDLILQEKQRANEFDRYLDKQRNVMQQRSADLRKQKRNSQYREQQRYLDQLRQQQQTVRRGHDWDHDPFFFAVPKYRYMRGGRYYEINEYAARLLQEAINYGYEEGFRAGEADRLDHWRYDYSSSYAYLDASYGYYGMYVSLSDYNFYFREGFRRGYEDGYYGRHRYGSVVDGDLRIMSDVLRLIIDLRVLR